MMESAVTKAPGAHPDFFAVMGLRRLLEVDLGALEATYHRLSREVHPDFHHHKPSEEREQLLAQSALVNRAYRTLRDFHERVAYLVELEGGEALKPKAPPELLAEVLDTQELLEERRAAGRIAADHPLVVRVKQEADRLRQRLERLEADLRAHAGEWDRVTSSNGAGAEDRLRVVGGLQDLLSQRVYLINLLRDIEAAQAVGA
jgi:molecular chaperone HscB